VLVGASHYAGVLDVASPANFAETYAAMERECKKRRGPTRVPFAEQEERGELLSWLLFLWGVYRVSVELGSAQRVASLRESIDRPTVRTANLHFPSGQVLVTDLEWLGSSENTPVLEVEPGWYSVTWIEDYSRMDGHECLESLEEYPEGDGPEWWVILDPECSMPPSKRPGSDQP